MVIVDVPSSKATINDSASPVNSVVTGSSAEATSNKGRLISVLENSDLYNIKHPLQSTWSLWLKKPDSGKDASGGHSQSSNVGLSSMEIWKKQVEHIGSVQSVEDFWCVFNNIPTVLQLQPQSDYFFFREGIVPMWEDEANRGGGMFQVTVGGGSSGGRDRPRDGPAPRMDWDGLWLNALMAAIGCTITEHHHSVINGINFGRRVRGDRIQVWMGPTTDVQRREIQEALEKVLSVGQQPGWYLKYSPFTDGSHGGHGGGSGSGGAGGRRDSGAPRRDSRHH